MFNHAANTAQAIQNNDSYYLAKYSVAGGITNNIKFKNLEMIQLNKYFYFIQIIK